MNGVLVVISYRYFTTKIAKTTQMAKKINFKRQIEYSRNIDGYNFQLQLIYLGSKLLKHLPQPLTHFNQILTNFYNILS